MEEARSPKCYTDKTGKKHEYIYCLVKEVDGLFAGWYFSDECQDLNGPFGTFEEVTKALEEYEP
jgi:hypothetical protein